MTKTKLVFIFLFTLTQTIHSFSQSSVLATGNWYKFSVSKEGIYCITQNDLISLGINVSTIDPRNIVIYGNPAGMLPVQNNVLHANDLQQLAILIKGEADGIFDANDSLFFYGESAVQVELDKTTNRFYHRQNLYSDSVSYFLTIGISPGKRIPAKANLPSFSNTTNKYTDIVWYDTDIINHLHSGKKWYGQNIKAQSSYIFHFDSTNASITEPVFINFESLERSLQSNGTLNLISNGYTISRPVQFVGSSITDPYGVQTFISSNISSAGNVKIEYNCTDTNATCWVDFIDINFTRNLTLYKSQQIFSDISTVNIGAITKFILGNVSTSTQIWDVTDPMNVMQQQFSASIPAADFNANNDSLHRYIAFDGQSFHQPVFTGLIPNQDLHALSQANMIIVTDKQFHSEAQILANFHQSHDNLTTIVADIDQIYNEYSSGVQDIVGVRDFIRQIFQRSIIANDSLKYVLLFGQASYDYKGHLGNYTSIVPTYESDGSLSQTQTYNSDNFFATMSDSASDKHFDRVEIGIGRLPVKNHAEAAVVNKIINYSTTNTLGPWRKKIIPIADDGDHNTHLLQCDAIMNILDSLHCNLDIDKIYFDSYIQDTISNQPAYPGVTFDLEKLIQNGALIINYIGHGDEFEMSDEKPVDIQYLENIKSTNLPLYFATTAMFNKFDDPSIRSRGEIIALNDSGAGIGLLGSSRPAFSSSSYNFLQVLYKYLFAKENNQYLRLGDILKKARQDYYLDPYVANNCLIGDPAVRLNYPKDEIAITSLNGHIPNGTDTLFPGQHVQIEGEIHDLSGNIIPSFNGIAYITLFDQKTQHFTLANDPGSSVIPFYEWDDTIYSDTALVVNGIFSESFNLPWSLDSGTGIGKISLYAENGNSDASGCFKDFYYSNLYAGIHEMDDVSVICFPNPASDKVEFHVSGIPVYDWQLNLFSIQGQNVKRESINGNDFLLDRNFISSGIYFFEILNSKEQLVKRGKIVFE